MRLPLASRGSNENGHPGGGSPGVPSPILKYLEIAIAVSECERFSPVSGKGSDLTTTDYARNLRREMILCCSVRRSLWRSSP
jgi:hypothetical protein